MSEWKKQVEEKARRTAIEYVLEMECENRVKAKARAGHKSDSDMIFGLFSVFMSIAMAIISIGFCALSRGSCQGENMGTAIVYLVLCVIMLVSGFSNIIKGLE